MKIKKKRFNEIHLLKMRRKFQQVIEFIKKQPRLWLVVFLLILVSLLSVIAYSISLPKEVIAGEEEEEKIAEKEYGGRFVYLMVLKCKIKIKLIRLFLPFKLRIWLIVGRFRDCQKQI